MPSLRKPSAISGRPASLSDVMEDMWRDPMSAFQGLPFLKEASYPVVDLSETDAEIVAKAELPGMDAKDVEITLRDNILNIQGEKKFEDEQKKDNYHRIERSYGCFYRAIPLPANVAEDDVRAKFDKGVLTVTMKKTEKGSGRKIQIEG